MKRLYRIGVKLLLLATPLLTACDKTPVDGDLDGNWQLVAVQQDSDSPLQEVKGERIYVGFRRGVVEFNRYTDPKLTLFGSYKRTADSLHVHNFVNGKDDSNPVLKDSQYLNSFYLELKDNGYEDFAFDVLNDDQMWLSQGEKKLHFRKF